MIDNFIVGIMVVIAIAAGIFSWKIDRCSNDGPSDNVEIIQNKDAERDE